MSFKIKFGPLLLIFLIIGQVVGSRELVAQQCNSGRDPNLADLVRECRKIKSNPQYIFADPACVSYCNECAIVDNNVSKDQLKTLKDAAVTLSKYVGVKKYASCANSITNAMLNFNSAAQGKFDGCDFPAAAKLAGDTACQTLKCLPTKDPASTALKAACDVGKWGAKIIACMDYNIYFMQGAKSACKAALKASNPVTSVSCPSFHSGMPVDACINGKQRTQNEIQEACMLKMVNREPKVPNEALGSCIGSCISASNMFRYGCKVTPSPSPSPTTTTTTTPNPTMNCQNYPNMPGCK